MSDNRKPPSVFIDTEDSERIKRIKNKVRKKLEPVTSEDSEDYHETVDNILTVCDGRETTMIMAALLDSICHVVILELGNKLKESRSLWIDWLIEMHCNAFIQLERQFEDENTNEI